MKECKHCKKEISITKIYCDRKCYNEDHYVLIKCISCSTSFKVPKNKQDRMYCSIKCANNTIDRKKSHAKAKQTLQSKHGVSNPFEVVGYNEINEKKDKNKLSENLKKAWSNRTEDRKKEIGNKISNSLNNKTIEEKKDILDKVKQTNMKLYGAEYTFSKESSLRSKIEKRWNNNFYDKLLIWLKDNSLELLEDYKGVKDKKGNIIYYKFKHLLTSNEFVDHIACGRLPIYHDPKLVNRISLAEQEISQFIEDNYQGNILTNNRHIIKGLEIDIFLPDLMLAIEFNGLKWHSENNGKDKTYHLYKTEECLKKNINLIHIFEDEWKYKQKIIKSKILNLLGKTPNKIYARKCEIKEVTPINANLFLNANHIQGEDKSKIRLGLYYEDKLVALITLGNYRKITGLQYVKDEYELIRYCSLLDTNVVGGFSKLFKAFIKTYNPNKVISYADRRFSQGKLYENNNFSFTKNTPPNYWYMKWYNHREHRFKYRKSELSKLLNTFNPNISEWENMKLNNYDRIWDCGSKKYEWVNNLF